MEKLFEHRLLVLPFGDRYYMMKVTRDLSRPPCLLSINETALFILRHLSEGLPPGKIAASIEESYETKGIDLDREISRVERLTQIMLADDSEPGRPQG